MRLAKHLNELVGKTLALPAFVVRVLPFFDEAGRADFGFLPTEAH